MTAELKRDIVEPLQLLPYAREVQAWLVDFIAAATSKKKPSGDYIRDLSRPSGVFVDSRDIDQALDYIKVIYHEQGYMPPWELEDRLIQVYNPGLPHEAMRVAEDFSAAQLARDPLTNYYQKPQTPLVMGLSALFTQMTDNPVSVFEIDFSNMRGTNEHNERVLQAAYPDMDKRAVQEAAMELTDQYAFLVASSILRSIEERLNKTRTPPVQLIPLRTGGDEVRVVAVNMTEEEAKQILPAVHDAIEATTASLALHDHSHAKRPLDNLSNGFGAAGAIFRLIANGQFDEAIARADKEIGNNKVEIGRTRAENSPFAALKPADFDIDAVYSDPQAASRYLDHLHHTIIRLGLELNIEPLPLTNMQTVEAIVHANRLDHIPGKTELQDMIFQSYLDDLARKKITLTPEQQKVLRIKVLKFPQDDPSSGALIGRDFPAIAGMAQQITTDMNERTGQKAALWTLGVSFHNLSGLNETLGHGHSNLVLRHQTAIIRESMHKLGIEDKFFQVAHMGNGDFHAVIQPVMTDTLGNVRVLTQQDMEQLSIEIQKRVDKLNNTPIRQFLQNHGIEGPEDLPPSFSLMPNPRDERCPGIRTSISAKPYLPDTTLNTHQYRQGGAIMRSITEHLTDMTTSNKQRWSREVLQVHDPNPQLGFPKQA